MKKSIYLGVVLSAFSTANGFSQEAFSLVDMNKMVLDPAFTATDTAFKHEASIYSKTYALSPGPDYMNNDFVGTYQMRLDKIHSGVGIMVNYDYMGSPGFSTENQLAAKLYYRYTILPGLSVGADAGFVNLNSNYNLQVLSFNEYGVAMPAQYTQIHLNNFNFDGGLGVLYQLHSFYAGFAIDHITKPEATYLQYTYTDYPEFISVKQPMLNYAGIAYNWVVGTYVGGETGGIDISAAYRSQMLNLNVTFELRHFFFGASAILENNYNNNIPEMFNGYNDYWVFMAGIKAYHNKIKASFGYDCYTLSKAAQLFPYSLEGGISYSF